MSMSSQENRPLSLSRCVEMIIEKGQITEEDQREVNRLGLLGKLSPEDVKALSMLTEEIQNGRVKVAN